MVPASLRRPPGALLAACALAACSGPPDAARLRHDAARAEAAAAAAPDPAADLVSAVSTADAQPPVYLKFRLGGVPRLGEPVELELVLSQEPKLEIDVLKVSLQPREGLQLRGNQAIDFGRPGIGAVHSIPVTLVPVQAGVTSLSVTVLVETERDSMTRFFLVPLVVPAPAAAMPAAPAFAPAAQPAPAARPRR